MARAVLLALALCATLPALAEGVHLRAEGSAIEDGWRQDRVTLALDAITGFRAFTLDAPRRLVLDLEDTAAPDLARMLRPDGAVAGVEALRVRPGWLRLEFLLETPQRLVTAEMRRAEGGARIVLVLRPVTEEEFAAEAGAPGGAGWEAIDAAPFAARPDAPVPDARPVVVIDAGHGGQDPGAIRDGVQEAQVMLDLAREVAAALSRPGDPRVVLTRDGDAFLPLAQRRSLARAAGADLLISLHADALDSASVQGVTVYTLGEAQADAATRAMIARHDTTDLIEGLDLSGQGDAGAALLLRLARERSGPQARRFAERLLREVEAAGLPLAGRPSREAQLAILASADVPAVLVETGFLSHPQDRARLSTPEGRAPLVEALTRALRGWAAQQGAAPLE